MRPTFGAVGGVASGWLAAALLAGCGDGEAPADRSDVADAAETGDDAGDDTGSDASPDTGADAADVADPEVTPDADAGATDVADTVDDADADADTVFDCIPHDPAADPLPTPPLHTPRWAFRPWISKDISDRDDTFSFVAGFRDRNIPVGVVVLDSPWETNYNTFIPNPSRYPDFAGMVAALREDDVRVVLWTTQLVNRYSFDFEIGGDSYDGPASNFAEGQACGYFINNGRTWPWWKGEGASVDFFHSGARAWWHAQQNVLLDMGVAGWKLDFGDEYVAVSEVETAIGTVPRQQYSEEYYRDFFAYGVQRVGASEFVTMVRPYDKSYQFDGRFFARPEHAPVSWVGDNRRDWIGFVDALDHTFRSAQAGYVVIGSDIGGYLDRDDQNIIDVVDPSDPTFYAWTGTAAFMPFFQLHGRANLEPWNYGSDPELTVAIYRYWATLHNELVPFFYSLAEQAHRNGGVLIEPVRDNEADWADDWRFVTGGTFLVAPPLRDEWARDVELPEGARWYSWWAPADPIAGGTTVAYADPDPSRIPVFVREGAIVPMDIESNVTGIADTWAAGALTLLVWPGEEASTLTVLEEGDDGDVPLRIDAGCDVDDGSCEVRVGPALRDVLVRVPAGAAEVVRVNGTEVEPGAVASLEAGTAWLDGDLFVWVRLGASVTEQSVELSPAR